MPRKSLVLAGIGVAVCFATLVAAAQNPPLLAPPPEGQPRVAPRSRQSFNHNWRFIRGDSPDAGDSLRYETIKPWIVATGADLALFPPARPAHGEPPGTGIAYTKPEYDDRSWRQLDLPHDWGVERAFDQELPGETGKLPWAGVAWYRKRFTLEPLDGSKRITVQFDGAMSYATVWLNGQFVGGWPYGYSSFELDLTPYVKIGDENVLAVRLDNPPDSSRWYPGGGVYRNVWLQKTDRIHQPSGGVFVTTPQVADEAALVDVLVSVRNDSSEAADLWLYLQICEWSAVFERAGATTRELDQPVAALAPVLLPAVAPGTQVTRSLQVRVSNPKRWTLENPQRYVAITRVQHQYRIADVQLTFFGIRTIAIDPDRGFFLNGERVQIKGVCNHHDLGAVGAAINWRALERQLELLREMGCNAIRTSHNPPAPELLDLCDRMGFLVMVEAFDAWRVPKKPNDYSRLFDDWHEKDLRAMVRRDRNHPSVVMWSIGNEVSDQLAPDGWRIGARLSAIVKEEDPTRPTIAAYNRPHVAHNGFHRAADITGSNYQLAPYAAFHAQHPTVPIMASETSSAVSSRGEYVFPFSNEKLQGRGGFHVSSYDLHGPRWAVIPDDEFRTLDALPFVAGEFVWTGFDYLGEPTPFNRDATNLLNFPDPQERAKMEAELKELGKIRVPSRSSYFGIIDLAGFPKDRFYLYQAHWRPDFPMAHIVPHWTWPERVGQVTPVHVYSSGGDAELFLNGRSLGRRQKKAGQDYRFRWDDVVYEPGELRVVTFKDGKPWAEAVQRTAGPAAKLAASADRAELGADGRDWAFVAVAVEDAAGRLAPRSAAPVTFSISGPAEIVATDNGDPTSHVPFSSLTRPAFNGRVLAIVRTKRGESPGMMTVRAESPGLAAAEVRIASK